MVQICTKVHLLLFSIKVGYLGAFLDCYSDHMHFIGLATNAKGQQKLSRFFKCHLFCNFPKLVGMCFTHKHLSFWIQYVLEHQNEVCVLIQRSEGCDEWNLFESSSSE
jgi:hypothetical protein